MYTTLCRISKCVRLQGKHDTSYTQVITPELPEDVRAKVGQVFGVLHAETDGKTGDALIAHTEDALSRAAAEVMTRSAGLPRDILIEKILTKTNAALDSVFGEYGLPVDRGSIRSVVVFLQGSTLSASFWGDASAYLVRLGDTPKLFDISAARESDTTAAAHYSELISGTTSSRDRLLLSTASLFPSIDQDTVLNILTSHRSDDAAMVLGDLFAMPKKSSEEDATVLRPRSVALIVAGEPAYSQNVAMSHSSVEGLLNTTSRTRDILSPPLLKPFTDKISTTMSRAASHIGKKASSIISSTQSTATNLLRSSSPQAQQISTHQEDTAANEIYSPHTPLRRILDAIVSLADASKRERVFAIIKKLPNIGNASFATFNRASRNKKIIITAIMTGIMIFNGGMMAVLAKQRTEKTVADYENALLTIQQKIDAAESSLIYNDYGRAKTLLDEATTLVAVLPNKTSEQQEQRNKLEASIAEERQAMRHESNLPDPTLLGTLPESANGTIQSLTLRGDTVIAATTAGELYTTSLKTKTTTKLGDSLGVAPQFVLSLTNALIYGGTDGNVRMISPDTGAINSTTTLEGIPDLTITDATFYGTSLYILDAPHNRIVKFPVTTKSFGKAQLSVKDGTDLSRGTSLSIDGAIFILNADGSIFRLNHGSKESYAVQEPDPSPQASAQLSVGQSTDMLYFIDNDRLLSYGKATGRFLGQYLSPSLKNVRDSFLDEKNKTLYVARDRDIAAITLP